MTALEFLIDHSPAPAMAPAPALLKAREALDLAAQELVRIPDDALAKRWRWRDFDTDVHFGLFRPVEVIEEASGEVAAVLAATGARRSAAARRIGPGTVARWALHGRLAGLDDDWLDRVGREGEWTVRQTLGHIVGGQRGYWAFGGWYWTRTSEDRPTDEERDAVQRDSALPSDDEEGVGTLADIRARLDEATDRGASHMASIPDDDLGKAAYYSGMKVDLGFRLARPSQHVMEHTIQIDKTLEWLGRVPTEAERIVVDLYSAWGRLESLIWPIEPAALAARDGDGRSVESILDELATEIVADARSTRAAAEA